MIKIKYDQEWIALICLHVLSGLEWTPSRSAGCEKPVKEEAVSKVFGTGFSGCQPAEIEVLRDEKGAPYVNLYGGAREIASRLGIKELKISITNTVDTATAFVIGCGGCQEYSEEGVQ